jgi:hypothetical protein
MPLAGMSGRVPPLVVEAVPSRVATTSLLLGFEILLRLAGLGKTAMVVLQSWWRMLVAVSLVEHIGASGARVRGSGEISVGLANTDTVMLVGATFPS